MKKILNFRFEIVGTVLMCYFPIIATYLAIVLNDKDIKLWSVVAICYISIPLTYILIKTIRKMLKEFIA